MNYKRPNNKAHNFDSEFDFFKGLGQVSGNFDQMPGITLKSRSKFCTLAFQRKFMSYNVPKGHLLSETSCNWHFSFVIGPSHLPQWSKSKKSCNFGEVALFASNFFQIEQLWRGQQISEYIFLKQLWIAHDIQHNKSVLDD